MLTASKLEKIMELEASLRAEYQSQLDEKSGEIARLQAKETEQHAAVDKLQASLEKAQGTIEKQLANIKDLSDKATANQRIEQLNRELTNRSEKLQTEVTDYKKRVKVLQKDLAEVRDENKILTQYDPARMRKNLDANKKKLAEKTKGNERLQKSLKETKQENAELQRKLEELEAKLAELEPAEDEASDADVDAETEVTAEEAVAPETTEVTDDKPAAAA